MIRLLSFCLVALALLTTSAVAAENQGRISGRLIDVRPEGKLVIEEQGPWTGPGTGVVTRMVDLTPATSIPVVKPSAHWDSTQTSPGYDVQSADFTVLRPGDFVTVQTGADRSSLALSVDIMRPDGADAGLAAPRFEPGR